MRMPALPVVAALAAGVLLAPAAPRAQTAPPPAPEQYTGTTVNMASGNGNKVVIQIFKWSPDADRDAIVAAVGGAGGDQQNRVKSVQDTATVGYVWTEGSLGYSLKYSHRQTLHDGGEQIVAMTDRPLGSWDRTGPWKGAKETEAAALPFTVIELHLNGEGDGQGKMSLSSAVATDPQSKTINLEHYQTAPVLLRDVKHKPQQISGNQAGAPRAVLARETIRREGHSN